MDIIRDSGVSTAEICAIGGDDLSQFSNDELTLLRYTEAVASAEVTDEIHAEATAVYDSAQLIALEMFAGFYIAYSFIVRVEALSFEQGEFVGWTPSDQRIEVIFG